MVLGVFPSISVSGGASALRQIYPTRFLGIIHSGDLFFHSSMLDLVMTGLGKTL